MNARPLDVTNHVRVNDGTGRWSTACLGKPTVWDLTMADARMAHSRQWLGREVKCLKCCMAVRELAAPWQTAPDLADAPEQRRQEIATLRAEIVDRQSRLAELRKVKP